MGTQRDSTQAPEARRHLGAAEEEGFDVVVVGASLAGCTAARLYAQCGLHVALVDKHRDPSHHKRLCTHYIQASARPTMQRLGLTAPLEAAGAIRNSARLWTRWGWIADAPDDRWGYSVRREVIDPMLRGLALTTPGVEGWLGWSVRDVVTSPGGRVEGVEVRAVDGRRRRLLGRLVVGADGAHSTVADRADVPTKLIPNGRFGYFAHYRGLQRPSGDQAMMWLLEPDVAAMFPNDDDITLITMMPSPQWRLQFDRGREAAFERYIRSLPDAPSLDGAERVTPLLGLRDHPIRHRPATPRPGLALVGDAATTSDPMWGVGCGWALQSAEWLVDATAQALADGGHGLAAGIRTYRRRRRHIDGHERLLVGSARIRDLNPLEQAWMAAAVDDPAVAEVFQRFVARELPASAACSPSLLRRIRATNRARRQRAGTAPAWVLAEEVERRDVVVDGLRSPMLAAGRSDASEAVVCVHGNPGCGEDFGHLVAQVGTFARAVAVDLPGFGHADKPADFPYDVAGYARHLDRVLDQLGIERAHLVLHDFGGPWGMRWAADHPDQVASVTLVNAALPLGYHWHQMARMWQTPGVGELLMATTTRSAMHRLLQVGAPRGLPRSYTDRVHATYDAGTRRAVLALYRASIDIAGQRDPIAEVLRDLEVPAHVVWGRHDPYLPLAQAYRQRDVFPDAEVQVLERSGHWPFVDDPDAFLAAVLPFLERVVATASTDVRRPVPVAG